MKKKELLQIIFSIVFMGLAFFFKNPTMRLIFFIISYLIISINVIMEAGKSLRKNLLDEHFLMTIATIGAFLIQEYPEAIMVMVLYNIGELFTDHAVDKSKEEISKLMEIRPDYANLLIDNQIKKVNPEEVHVGDLILIKSGEKIPLDGVITEGESTIDTSHLTGESTPHSVKEKDTVLNGCINLSGTITVKVEKEFQDSTVHKILELVEHATEKKATSEKFITKFSKYYTPIVVGIALCIGIIPPLLFSSPFTDYLERAFVFLVISCPCALVISVPLGFFCGIGSASRHGILVKGSEFLEKLDKVDTFVFDKTGTLTKGVFEVSKIHTEGIEKEKLIEYAAYCEMDSSHPIAISIKNYYGKIFHKKNVTKMQEKSGFGINATVYKKKVIVGNKAYMEKEKIDIPEIITDNTIVYVAIDNEYHGAIEIDDGIKEDAKETIQQLKNKKVKNCIMLTGDKDSVAKKVSDKLNLDHYRAELLPADKVTEIKKLLKKGMVAFVGDGINDAPVLATSDIGISMGNIGSDAAIEASDIVLMTDQLSKLPEAIKISRKTLRIVKENIVFAITIKLVILALGAIGLANMWMAVLADVGVSILAILNSLRAFRL